MAAIVLHARCGFGQQFNGRPFQSATLKTLPASPETLPVTSENLPATWKILSFGWKETLSYP